MKKRSAKATAVINTLIIALFIIPLLSMTINAKSIETDTILTADYGLITASKAPSITPGINTMGSASPISYSADSVLNKRLIAAAVTILLALLVAWAVTAQWKRQLISRRKQDQANLYIESRGVELAHSTDTFLYKNVTRTKRMDNIQR